MKSNPLADAKLRRTGRPAALHEAGHFVIGLVLGFVFKDVHIRVNSFGADGGCNVTLQPALRTLDDVVGYLRKRCQMLCAGAMAQHLGKMGVDSQLAKNALGDGNAKDDWSKVRENVRVICGISSPDSDPTDQLEVEALAAMNIAEELVWLERETILALAAALLKTVSAPGGVFRMSVSEVMLIPEIQKRFGGS